MAHEDIQRERAQVVKLGADALGVDPHERRVMLSEVGAMGREAEILQLPDSPDNATPTQTSSGAQVFVLGISDPDGPDVIL